MQAAQFLAAKNLDNELIGFGRIKHHDNCDELCSLGVIESQRYKGIGRYISSNLVQVARQPLYLVSIIPSFFERVGFNVVTEYPLALKEKLEFCTLELSVPEPYVVMKYYGLN